MENPQYLITSPYIYRAGEEEEVTVHLIGSKSCEVNVTLKPQRNKEIVASARGIFIPNERGTLKLKVKYIDYFVRDFGALQGPVVQSFSVNPRLQFNLLFQFEFFNASLSFKT